MKNDDKITNFYSILNQNEVWFNRSFTLKTKREAITKVGLKGDIQYLNLLVPFLVHSSEILRNESILSISTLINKTVTKKDFDSLIRHCKISKLDLDKYINLYTSKDLIYPLVIASSNWNGFIREKALKLILEYKLGSSILPFVIYRLGDWVKEVRQIAKSIYLEELRKENLLLILENLEVLYHLKNIQRVDLSIIYSNTMDFLVSKNQKETFSNFDRLNDKKRFQLAISVLKSDLIEIDTLKKLLKDRSYQIRSKVAAHIGKIKINSEDIFKLQKDKSSLVREICLKSRLNCNLEVSKFEMEEFLFDRSAVIRDIAKYILKIDNLKLLQHYKERLNSESFKEISIYGIGDVGQRKNANLLIEYLQDPRSRIKKAALRTIIKLNPQILKGKLKSDLNNPVNSIRKIVIEELSKSPNDEDLNEARLIYTSTNIDLKLSMLSFFSKVGSLKTLPDIIYAVSDKNEIISDTAWSYLANWRKNTISNYSDFSYSDVLRAKSIYENTKFDKQLTYNRIELWKELPFYARF